MPFYITYRSTFYWDWMSGPMPEYDQPFKNLDEAKEYLSDKKHEAVEVIKVYEGTTRPDLIKELNKFCASKKDK